MYDSNTANLCIKKREPRVAVIEFNGVEKVDKLDGM